MAVGVESVQCKGHKNLMQPVWVQLADTKNYTYFGMHVRKKEKKKNNKPPSLQQQQQQKTSKIPKSFSG